MHLPHARHLAFHRIVGASPALIHRRRSRTGLLINICMLCRQRRNIRICLSLRLYQQIRPAPLIEPSPNPPRQRPISLRRNHCRLPVAARRLVILLHRGLPSRQLLLNLPALIPTYPRQVIARIVQLIRIQLQLRLRKVQIVRKRIRHWIFILGCSRKLCSQIRHPSLVFLNQPLQIRHLLL